MAGRQLQAQNQARARAAADVMSSRALDRHPDLPEKSLAQRVYGEPSTRSGVVEGWDAPPPTIVSDDFQARRAAGLQSMADADRFAAMSNAPPSVFPHPSRAPALDELSFVSTPPAAAQNLGSVVDIPHTQNFQWPPIGSPVTQGTTEGVQSILGNPDYWGAERFPDRSSIINVSDEAIKFFLEQGRVSKGKDYTGTQLEGDDRGIGKAFVIHHTAGMNDFDPNYQSSSGKAPGPFSTRRGTVAHFVINRDGSIHQVLPTGVRGVHAGPGDADKHFDPSRWGNTKFNLRELGNSNTMGVEIVSDSDKDVTDAQIEAAFRLAAELGYNPDEIVGHGEWTGKRETEGDKVLSALTGKLRNFYTGSEFWDRDPVLKTSDKAEYMEAVDPGNRFISLVQRLWGTPDQAGVVPEVDRTLLDSLGPYPSILADTAAADVGMIEAVDAGAAMAEALAPPAIQDGRFERFRPGQDLGMVDPGQAYPGSVRLGAPGAVTPGAVEDPYWAGERFPESTYLGSERQVADTAAWQQMLEEKAMREAMEGYGSRTPVPAASALGATDYPFQTGPNVVGYGPGGLGDIPPADVTDALMRGYGDPVLPAEDAPGARVAGPFIPYPTNVHPDAMVPPYWAGEQFPDIDRQYPVPTGQDDPADTPFASRTSDATIEAMIRDNEREVNALDRRFAGMGEGPSGDIGRLPIPSPSAEAVEAVEIYRSEAADELRDTLRAEGSNEAIALADQLDIEQRFGAGQDFEERAFFYFPEDAVDLSPEEVMGLSPEAQAAIDQVVATEGQNVDAVGEVVGVEDRVLPSEPMPQMFEGPEQLMIPPSPLVAGAVEPAPTAPSPDYPREAGMDFAPTAEGDVLPPEVTGDVGPVNIEEAQTLEDWTAALYGEPPGVPQFPVVPYPGSPELTKMGFYAQDYKQSDLVNPPSEMIRNAFPWARDLPTDVLERAARDGEFFRSLVDQYEARAGGPMGFGQPEAVGAAPPWVNPEVAAPPANFGADRGPPLPPELAAQIAAAGGAPVEEVAVDTSVADARAALNEWVDEHGDNLLKYFNIDVSPLKGTFSKADIESFYQQLLKIKDRTNPFTGELIFSPDVWEKVEFIYRTLG